MRGILEEESCYQMLSKKSRTEIKANVSSKEPQGLCIRMQQGVKQDLRLLKKRQREPDTLTSACNLGTREAETR